MRNALNSTPALHHQHRVRVYSRRTGLLCGKVSVMIQRDLVHGSECVYAPFRLPDPGSVADRVLAAELTGQCGNYENALEARICRYRVTSPYRWRHYRDNTAAPAFGIIVAVAVVLVGGVFGRRIYRWVRAGFDQS